MATRLKTVYYSFPALASLTNNTLTNLTQITVYLPETTKTFKSVILKVTADDIITATGGSLTTKTINLRLGAAAYTSTTNANTHTNSGENCSFLFTRDFLSHFTTNWSGTSMTCDVQAQINQSTGTTTGFVNVCATLIITYEYDDTSATQVKSVWIPLNCPVGALAVTKPGTANDVIPALDTYCPETGKVYRDSYIIVQGNEHRNAATTDHTLNLQIDTTAQLTSGNMGGALASDRWFRYVWNINSLSLTTNATHDFFIWASEARCNHLQAWLVVTYEFTNGGPATVAWAASTAYSVNDVRYGLTGSGKNVAFRCSTAGTSGATEPAWSVGLVATTTDGTVTWTVLSVLNSLFIPMDLASPMGGTASTDAQQAEINVWIQEPGTISLQRLAYFAFWDQAGAISGLNFSVGTGSYVTYTDTALNLSGGNGCMIRNDAPTGLTLARGRNNLILRAYRTDTADLGWNFSGFWILNYHSAQHKDGIGSHNHSVEWNILTHGTGVAVSGFVSSAIAVGIPETDYFITSVGNQYEYESDGTSTPAGVSIGVERLSAEGGVKWEEAYKDAGQTDPELGIRTVYSTARYLFKRWTGDPESSSLDIETARRWRVYLANGATAFHSLDIIVTYHTITYTISGTITNSAGGTVNLSVYRPGTGELVLTGSRSGNGSYTFTWFEGTENVFVAARESSTKLGRSDDGLAG